MTDKIVIKDPRVAYVPTQYTDASSTEVDCDLDVVMIHEKKGVIMAIMAVVIPNGPLIPLNELTTDVVKVRLTAIGDDIVMDVIKRFNGDTQAPSELELQEMILAWY